MRSKPLKQAESGRQGSSLCRSVCRSRRLTFTLPAFWALAMLASGAIVDSQTASTQTTSAQTNPTPAPTAAPTHKHVHPRKKPAAEMPAPQPPPPPAPVAPPPPNWPANDIPGAASVVFDSRGLLVVASNSSLSQILKEVSIETGAKVEGMDADQRIFGTYGPGPARDVISQLLDGSGYDVLMIGDRGEGTPRRIVLTDRSGSTAKTTANNTPPPPGNEDTDADQPAPEPQPEQEPPQPNQNGAAPPVPVRTPQQIMQEIQERQRRQQNAQQGEQQNPQN
jgi:outer membrane biosynthesis protein TonB